MAKIQCTKILYLIRYFMHLQTEDTPPTRTYIRPSSYKNNSTPSSNYEPNIWPKEDHNICQLTVSRINFVKQTFTTYNRDIIKPPLHVTDMVLSIYWTYSRDPQYLATMKIQEYDSLHKNIWYLGIVHIKLQLQYWDDSPIYTTTATVIYNGWLRNILNLNISKRILLFHNILIFYYPCILI